MDALGKIILPTQVIWAGETGQQGIRNKIPAEHMHEEYLRHDSHEQSNSHWTVLETLKRLVLMLAQHVKTVCEAEVFNHVLDSAHRLLLSSHQYEL